MLTTTSTRRHNITEEDAEFIHNYYERRVLEEIFTRNERARQDRDFLGDVACVALNRLPPRYIRHDVDMTFFMSPAEMQEIDNKVAAAVNAAIVYVESREGGDAPPAVNTPAATKKTKKPIAKKAKKS